MSDNKQQIINEDRGSSLAKYINNYIKDGKGKTTEQLLKDLKDRFESVNDYNIYSDNEEVSGYVDEAISKLTPEAKKFLGGNNGAKFIIYAHIRNLINTGKAMLNGKSLKILNEETKVNYFNY